MNFKHLTILAVVLSLLISGCGSSSPFSAPVVHAAPPPLPYAGGCANSQGLFGTTKESPGSYLALLDTACGLFGIPQPIETDTQTLDSCGKDQVVTVTTSQDIHVHAIRLWIGAGVGSLFETGVCLEIIPPPGTAGYKAFHSEWDKHKEEHRSDQPFAVDFIIPAGSVVSLSREPHSAGFGPDGGFVGCKDFPTNNCATQEMAELWGD